MEPRPQRPSRATGPYISTGTPNPPGASAGSGGSGGYGNTAAFDASSAPPAPPPAIGYDPDYSPGQPLTPLRGPRGANIVGPLLAVAALAIIVAAVAWIVTTIRDGGNDNNSQPTTIAATGASPTSASGQQGNTSDPTEAAVDNGDSPTEAPADTSNAEPTNTPRVNRATEAAGDLSAPTNDGGSGDEAPVERTRARQWLPTESRIGDGFEQADNGTRSEEEVAGSFPDPADAAEKLTEFGWRENAFRNYAIANSGEADTNVMTVSVHRFDSESGARDAMPYFAEGGQTGSGLEAVDDAADFGEESITLQGAIEGGNAYVIYIRQNNFVFRIGGFSPVGDPAEVTTGVAERIMET